MLNSVLSFNFASSMSNSSNCDGKEQPGLKRNEISYHQNTLQNTYDWPFLKLKSNERKIMSLLSELHVP